MNISSKKGKKNIVGETSDYEDEEDEDNDDWLYDDEEYEEDESLHKIIMCSCN